MILEGICTDQRAGVSIYMERYVIQRTPEQIGQVLREDVLAGRLGAGQENILSLQQGCDRHREDFITEVRDLRLRQTILHRVVYGVLSPEIFQILLNPLRKV